MWADKELNEDGDFFFICFYFVSVLELIRSSKKGGWGMDLSFKKYFQTLQQTVLFLGFFYRYHYNSRSLQKYHYNFVIWKHNITTSWTSDERYCVRSAMSSAQLQVYATLPYFRMDAGALGQSGWGPRHSYCLPHLTHILPTQLLTLLLPTAATRSAATPPRRRRPEAPILKARRDAPGCLQWIIRSRASCWRWGTTRASMDLLPPFVLFCRV
jgi:hypothetical protein